MSRIVLAGGLDNERAAFAAELADAWNAVPLDCQPYHDPMRIIEPEQVDCLDDLEFGSWVLHGNHFTNYQARAVGRATQVIIIGFDSSQMNDTREYKASLRSRDRVRSWTYAFNKTPIYMADVFFKETPDSPEVIVVNVLAQTNMFLDRYKRQVCVQHICDLRVAQLHAQE